MVGDAIFGIASSKSGALLIEKWVNEAKASVKTNLIWRAIALNQNEGVAEVDAALAHAVGNDKSLTVDSWANVGASVKWNKIADLYKKALSLNNANLKSGVNPVNTRGLDKVLLTVGDYFLKPFARVVDYRWREGRPDIAANSIVAAATRQRWLWSKRRLATRVSAGHVWCSA